MILEGAARRDIIVIGGSAGGLEALCQVLSDLPEDLPAAVFALLHMGASSHLAQILDQKVKLPVLSAEKGMVIQNGRVYVAVPGVHLLLHDDHILLRRGPRENLARPALDPLFRSAACTFGSRVIGVVLSGALSDGAAGLRAIKRCGGMAVVQDPAEAAVPSMPQSAIRHVAIDHVAPAHKLAALLVKLTRQPAGLSPEIPLEIRLETAIAAQELSSMAADDKLGTPSRFTCPECHGALWQIDDGNLLRYRCHVGHAYTADAMLSAQTVRAEEMLWSLMRTHQERAELARRMAAQERSMNRERLAEELLERAHGYEEDAQVVATLLRSYRSTMAAEEPEQEVP